MAMQVPPNSQQRARIVEKLKIANKYIGHIIGKGGHQINKIKTETGAGVKVTSGLSCGAVPPPDQDSVLSTVTISGTPEAVEKAKNWILKICQDREASQSLVNFEIPIPKESVDFIIGKCKQLQADTGARLKFKPDDACSANSITVIQGSKQQIQKAKKRINKILKQRDKDLVKNLSTEKKPKQNQQKRSEINGKQHAKKCHTPVGSGRCYPNQREFGSQNKISVPKESATVMIGKKCKTMGIRNCSKFQKDHFPVRSSKFERFTGKGGENIRKIEQASGAYFDMKIKISKKGQSRSFTVRGTNRQVQLARNMIRKCMEKSRNQFIQQGRERKLAKVNRILRTTGPKHRVTQRNQFIQQGRERKLAKVNWMLKTTGPKRRVTQMCQFAQQSRDSGQKQAKVVKKSKGRITKGRVKIIDHFDLSKRPVVRNVK